MRFDFSNVRSLSIGAAMMAASTPVAAQLPEASPGPAIHGFGPVFDVERPDFATPSGREWRAVFDVAQTSEDPGRINQRIETVARFLNMHARAGVPAERIHAALVLHGEAGRDALASPAYRQRFEVDNPNRALLAALQERGVRVVLCGQTAASRGLPRDQLAQGVEVALSAMTALVSLQSEGYALIAF